MWQTGIPSRFLDELPEAHVDVVEEASDYGGYGSAAYGASRFDTRDPFAGTSTYSTPGWQRAQRNRGAGGDDGASAGTSGGRPPGGRKGAGRARGFDHPLNSGPRLIEGELVAKSVIGGKSEYSLGERVFHQKFGYGRISAIDGNKLTVEFDKAGQKKVLDSFVERP
jgi:DNA helicase-2/ATP-dependent DNA helicase PcrA